MSLDDGAVPRGATAADGDALQDMYGAGFWTKVLLNGTLIAIITYLLMKIFMKRNEPQQEEPEDAALPKMKKRDFTIQELREFDGTKGDGRILVAINGKVFDVTKGKHFYGPGAYPTRSSFSPSRVRVVVLFNRCTTFLIFTLIVLCCLWRGSIRNPKEACTQRSADTTLRVDWPRFRSAARMNTTTSAIWTRWSWNLCWNGRRSLWVNTIFHFCRAAWLINFPLFQEPN